LSISVRLRNLVRGGLGPIWAVSAIEEVEEEEEELPALILDLALRTRN
jgi:hypothetical protein